LYFGEAGWHRDSGVRRRLHRFRAYLEALDADTGAARRPARTGAADRAPPASRCGATRDVIVFDEHLCARASVADRRQWRVDYVADPSTAEEHATAYFAGMYRPDWDGGYDVDRYPTATLAVVRAAVGRAVAALGAYDLAAAEEAYARLRRREPPHPFSLRAAGGSSRAR
jgi:hypothetical protein